MSILLFVLDVKRINLWSTLQQCIVEREGLTVFGVVLIVCVMAQLAILRQAC